MDWPFVVTEPLFGVLNRAEEGLLEPVANNLTAGKVEVPTVLNVIMVNR